MREFTDLSKCWQGILGLLALVGFIMFTYNLLCWLFLGRRSRVFHTALLLALSFAHTQIMIMNAAIYPHYPAGIHLKAVPAFFTCLAFIAAAAAQQIHIRRWKSSHVSAMSVKEAFDRLPAGLCCYLPGGLIKLVNTSMDALCREAAGTPLMDPEGFWRDLTEGRFPASLQGGETPMLRFADGRVYRFSRRELETELGPVQELLAVDVSDDWNLNRELQKKQAKTREINLRLKALLGSIEYVTMSRELLQLKTELHDALGQSLLLSKRWLLDPESTDEARLRETWLGNLRLLESSRPESWQKPYYLQKKQAEALGVRLEFRGRLPEERRLIPVVETALSVHMTNVLRHAGGSVAMVDAAETPEGCLLTFTNDGVAPSGPIREGGGLSNLREAVEALGGSMTIQASPLFRLELRLPAGDAGSL